ETAVEPYCDSLLASLPPGVCDPPEAAPAPVCSLPDCTALESTDSFGCVLCCLGAQPLGDCSTDYGLECVGACGPVRNQCAEACNTSYPMESGSGGSGNLGSGGTTGTGTQIDEVACGKASSFSS